MHDSYRHATNRRLVPALFALLALACGKPNPDGPHLLILTIDTLRQDALGAFGSHTARTPHLDRLAAEGSTLANAQTAAPTTLPSHATMFTGYYPATHGARHNGRPLAQSHVTLAELLRERGYDTAAFVASMVLHRSYGLDQGFDEYDDAWFAWVHYYDPHAPYEPVTPFAGSEKSAYAAEVSDCDRSFGSIRAMLERSGDWENTIVIVLSDHGEGLGEHGESEHGLHVYETTIAIPWIVKVPAAIGPAETIVPWPVETVDLVPTVLQWLAPRHEQDFAGRSFRSLLAGEAGDDERPLYAESYYGAYGYDWAPLHALRIGDWKLVSGVYDELFSLQDSPPETLDRAGTDAAERNRLARRLDVVRRTWKETAPDQGTDSPSLDAAQRSALEALGYVTAKSSGNRETRPDTRAVYPAHELIMAGRAHFLAGDLGSAASKFQRALSIDPDNVDALVRLADCYRLQGEPAREESVTVRILELDPAHAASWSNLGLLVEKKLDLDRAYECYENAIAADSNFFHAYANRANLRIVKKDLAGAEADYRAALALNDAYAEAHLGLARVAHARGDWAEVVRELRVTIRLNPEDRRAVDWLRAIEEAHARGEIDITGA